MELSIPPTTVSVSPHSKDLRFERMNAKKEIKFFALIIPVKDIEGFTKMFPKSLSKGYDVYRDYMAYRKSVGKKENEYICVNQDEPYIEEIWQVILEGEDAKLKPQASELPLKSDLCPDCKGMKGFGTYPPMNNDDWTECRKCEGKGRL